MNEKTNEDDATSRSNDTIRGGNGSAVDEDSNEMAAGMLSTNPADEPPPDGGWQAWLVLLGAFIVTVHAFGIANSFGSFQTFYETDLLEDHPSSDISWIGSLQAALLTLSGIISGPLYDMGYFHYLLGSGLFLVVFGMFMTSLCTAYYQVILAQGVAVGLGCGLMFLPATALLSQYFARRRSLALGIQSAGSPFGGIIFPIIFSRLQPMIGFGWATRVIAFILLATAPIPLIFMKPRLPPPKQKRAFLDNTAFTDIPFILCGIGCFFAFLGIYVPFFYVELYSIHFKIADPYLSSYLLTLVNAGSIFGRLLPNIYAPLLGAMNMLTGACFGAAVLAFGWLGIHNLAGIIVFSLFYGFFNGGVTSLPPTAVVTLTQDLSRIGGRLGMIFVMIGLSTLIGNPIAGVILGNGDAVSSWQKLIVFSATTLLAGSFFFLLSQIFHIRKQKKSSANSQ